MEQNHFVSHDFIKKSFQVKLPRLSWCIKFKDWRRKKKREKKIWLKIWCRGYFVQKNCFNQSFMCLFQFSTKYCNPLESKNKIIIIKFCNPLRCPLHSMINSIPFHYWFLQPNITLIWAKWMERKESKRRQAAFECIVESYSLLY